MIGLGPAIYATDDNFREDEYCEVCDELLDDGFCQNCEDEDSEDFDEAE